MLLLPSLNTLQNAQISMPAADLEMRELKSTHVCLIVLIDVVQQQALAQIQQLRLT